MTTEWTCPGCGHAQLFEGGRYLPLEEDVPASGLQDRAQVRVVCDRCGAAHLIVPPLIVDLLPSLLVFVADADRPTLLEEFRELLDDLAEEIAEERFATILASSYQVVVGLDGLHRLLDLVLGGATMEMLLPATYVVPMCAHLHLLVVAKEYADAGRDADAYQVLLRSAAHALYNPDFFRELSGYAHTAGDHEVAEAALTEAELQEAGHSHVWIVLLPAGTHIGEEDPPADLCPPTLFARVRDTSQPILPDPYVAARAGMLVGEIERAIVHLGPTWELSFYRETMTIQFEQWLESQELRYDPQDLVEIFVTERREALPEPDDTLGPEELGRLGAILADSGHEQQALPVLHRAIGDAAPGTMPIARYNLAALLDRTGAAAEAVPLYRDVAAGTDLVSASMALLALGRLYQERGDDQEARLAFDDAVSLGHPAHGPQALLELARLEGRRGDTATQESHLVELVEAQIEDVSEAAALDLGVLRIREGDAAGAVPMLELAADSLDDEIADAATELLSQLRAR
ncbi:tetratricopeptide repeat protein [Nonomuraea roseola]|uniref:Tetratricopeptide repeat protein n=1 Tax=Nonomuraea roseola TaxID=46179 RepID=A0ABV5PTG9_9ACTN